MTKSYKSLLILAISVFLIEFMLYPLSPHTAKAQAGATPCDTTIQVSAAASASSVVFAAVPGTTVYVCGYDFSGDTAATTAQWASGSTNISGAELMPVDGSLSAGDGIGILLSGVPGSGMSIKATTGAIAGWVRAGQN